MGFNFFVFDKLDWDIIYMVLIKDWGPEIDCV